MIINTEKAIISPRIQTKVKNGIVSGHLIKQTTSLSYTLLYNLQMLQFYDSSL